MSIILESLAMPAIAEAIEASMSEEMAWFGRAMPQGELHKTTELLWIYTGTRNPNGVLRSCFASDDLTYVSSRIDEMLSFFATRSSLILPANDAGAINRAPTAGRKGIVPFGWTIGPSTRPANLASLLEARGFTHRASTTGMAIDLRDMREDIQVNRELVIREIEDLETLKILRAIEMQGFGASQEAAQVYYETYARAGFGNSQPWHHYIGWLYDQPVAIASILYHAGVAGIYGIATIPEARRQGAGGRMTLHTLYKAREQGYRIAILSPTDMSEAMYRRIGFQEYCKLLHYGSPLRMG